MAIDLGFFASVHTALNNSEDENTWTPKHSIEDPTS